MKKLLLTLVAAGLFVTGCTTASDTATAPDETAATDEAMPEMDGETMPEMDGMETSEGNVDIALVSSDSVPMGDAELLVAVTDTATGDPVNTDNMQVEIYMPMDGMEPMQAEADVSPSDEPGQYKVVTYLGMEGTWAINTEVAEGDQQGKAHFMIEAQ